MTQKTVDSTERDIRLIVQFTTYLGYALLMISGYIREGFRKLFPKMSRRTRPGYAPLVRDFDDFYQRRLYTRIRDCWNRPIDTRPSRVFGVMERVSEDYNQTFKYTGKSIPAINLGSYNYLGFSESPPYVTDEVIRTLKTFGIGSCAATSEWGMTTPLVELEREVALFVGKEDAIVCGMGFATNSGGIPSLLCGDTLVFSAALNHASIVAGVRSSKAKVVTFPHDNLDRLEHLIRKAIIDGQPRTHRPWKRIILLVEGIYSMEGEIINLRRLVELRNKYKCLIYLDEAHSIGALGSSGKGACDHFGVSPNDVDILMGTFTKSFGSVGGYIAGNRDVVNLLRKTCSLSTVSDAMSPAAVTQALMVMKLLQGKDGTTIGRDRIRQLRENSTYFRQGLIKLGLTVLGDDASPVIPIMLYNPAKMPASSRECLKRNLAVVVVGYPATSLIESRIRICVSAAHTREDLDRALQTIDEVAGLVGIRYERWNYFQ